TPTTRPFDMMRLPPWIPLHFEVLVRGVVIYPDRVGVEEVITLDRHDDCDRAAHLP
ncbi:hypothetical protein PISMIDRAFT_688703, partial [Pisolithus microcarpus 441]